MINEQFVNWKLICDYFKFITKKVRKIYEADTWKVWKIMLFLMRSVQLIRNTNWLDYLHNTTLQ